LYPIPPPRPRLDRILQRLTPACIVVPACDAPRLRQRSAHRQQARIYARVDCDTFESQCVDGGGHVLLCFVVGGVDFDEMPPDLHYLSTGTRIHRSMVRRAGPTESFRFRFGSQLLVGNRLLGWIGAIDRQLGSPKGKCLFLN
jgi:hypothetical protein